MQRWNKLFYDNKILILGILSLSFQVIGFAQDQQSNPDDESFLIVLDPGHGGKDHGCSGHGSIEKEIVLKISNKLKELIEDQMPEASVLLTRTDDRFVPLYERAEIANKNHADIFLSIHCNAINHSKTKGTETYIIGLHKEQEHFEVAKRENASILLEQDHQVSYHGFDPNSLEAHIFLTVFQTAYREQSILLAQLIEEEFSQHGGRKSRGVKEAGFVVLRATAMPSVLVESGFLTHSEESQFLNSKKGIELMSDCIYRAINRYVEQMHILEKTPPKPVVVKNTETNPELDIANDSIRVESNEKEQYTIQFLALSQAKALDEIGLENISKVEIVKEKGVYKYRSGLFFSREDAEQALIAIKELGFPNAFIKRLDSSTP